ncbi:hypothetical protein [uncultured Aquimarina sp.]|uniref:hypothetical protein n=1 Tax=uncultured Aquimarina sp. TaxID=575652 RepID=UPI00262FDAAA|nr:hypothetical protein [uncultured Aquimarina sp.]
MTKKRIDNLLKKESGIILLKKESENTFWETILENIFSIATVFYFLTRKKFDYLILTEYRVSLIIRNKLLLERVFIRIENLNYNRVKSTLELTDQNQQFSISLSKLRISYEESQLIRQKLSEFQDAKK